MGEIVTVNFRGDQLYGFKEGETVFVALKPIVEAMGMDWSAQFRRVQRDPILAEGIAMMATPFGRGGDQEALCIRLDLVNGWLFTIDSSRIKDEAVRQKVVTYQRECYRVLHDHFTKGRKPRLEAGDGEPIRALSENEKRALVAEARQTFGQMAGRELWFHLELPITPAMIEIERQPSLFTYTAIRRDDIGAAAA